MAFADALQDIATFSTISTAIDGFGQQVKTATPLYTSIASRLSSLRSGSVNEQGAFEDFQDHWIIIVQPQFNGANRGDRVVVGSQTFLIIKKHDVRGQTSAIHHTYYILKEQV